METSQNNVLRAWLYQLLARLELEEAQGARKDAGDDVEIYITFGKEE